MLDQIRPFYFVLAFSLGIAYVYATSPKPQVVMKFPSPSNHDKVMYKDNSDSCYKYNVEKLDCDDVKDPSKIRSQPVMESFKAGKPNTVA